MAKGTVSSPHPKKRVINLHLMQYVLQSWARDKFLASQQRQRNNVKEPQGPEKIRKIVRPQYLDWVATTNIEK